MNFKLVLKKYKNQFDLNWTKSKFKVNKKVYLKKIKNRF